MSAGHLFLIIVSVLGIVHGLFLAVFLWLYQKGNLTSNRILSVLLLVLSFRVGKSVFLEFTTDLDVKFIFIGLGTLMIVGPLYYLYVRSYTDRTFKLNSRHIIHFIPAVFGISFGFWVRDVHLETLPLALFAVLFLSYYSHYLVYIIIGFTRLLKLTKEEKETSTYKWPKAMFIGLLIIWFAYVLNLFDEQVPYIIGPILYSITAYFLSFLAFKKGYLDKVEKYKTTPVSDEQVDALFNKLQQLVVHQEQFKNPDITLKSLSGDLKISTQILSLVINQKSGMNYNSFVNHYRVNEAIRLFEEEQNDNQTIASIAFEVGFNSLSSFNSAFKKQTGKTPKKYRDSVMK